MGLIPTVLAIDAGNSKTDVAVVTAGGEVLATARGGGFRPPAVGVGAAVDALAEPVARAFADAGATTASHVSACLANADLPVEEEQLAAALHARAWGASVEVRNDTFAILRAGVPEPRGVAVVCGAGINCVGMRPDGRTARFPAIGRISGDWGGGWGLAEEALWYAARAEDGRGPDTLLTGYLISHFGVERVEDVTIGIHKGKISGDDLTSLAPLLLRAADEGDQVARTVVSRLADEISVMSITAMRRLGLTGLATPVVLGGGVVTARNPLLMSGITAQLAAAAPAAEVRVIDVPPVAGAALLGLDQVHAPPAAAARLRAAYGVPVP